MNKPDSVVFKTHGALLKSILFGDVGFGDAFMDGQIEVKEDLADFFEKNTATRLLPYIRRNRVDTHQHYDIPVEFYKIMLGSDLVYTCANWVDSTTLEMAQLRKQMRHFDWLKLRPDNHVLECGFGWGDLSQKIKISGASYTGVTVSREQWSYAIEQNHHRDSNYHLNSWETVDGVFDRFTSICMLEHVGLKKMPAFVKWIHDRLEKGGIGTLQFISRDKPISPWADKHIFPGAEPPQLNSFLRLMKQNGLAVTNLRECSDDYVLTLQAWLDNVMNNQLAIKALGLDDRFIRMMHLYLSGGIATFRSGDSQIIQLRFEKI